MKLGSGSAPDSPNIGSALNSLLLFCSARTCSVLTHTCTICIYVQHVYIIHMFGVHIPLPFLCKCTYTMMQMYIVHVNVHVHTMMTITYPYISLWTRILLAFEQLWCSVRWTTTPCLQHLTTIVVITKPEICTQHILTCMCTCTTVYFSYQSTRV